MKCFIGWDSREELAYKACVNSIMNINNNVPILPLKRTELTEQGIYRRKDESGATEFTYTRFLVPYLCNYQGWAAFFDCDFIFTEDLQHLFEIKNDSFAIMCVKHEYVPKNETKMDGQKQVAYPRKNWSSLILWNCSHPANKALTPEIINKESGSFLHRFQWLSDNEIGDIPIDWNWLEGEYPKPSKPPKGIHFTNGGPWFSNCQNVDYAELWQENLQLRFTFSHIHINHNP